jgi:DnaK suppressor protein
LPWAVSRRPTDHLLCATTPFLLSVFLLRIPYRLEGRFIPEAQQAVPASFGAKKMTQDPSNILLRELEEVQRQIEKLEQATESKPDYGLGEGDPEITRWEMDKALLKQLKERKETLERAVSGSGDNAYGVCEKCGNPIHPDRLAILPDTTTCINCAREAEHQ